jgi:hypothetical protein
MNIISRLLLQACPSIQYRLRRELQNQPLSDSLMLALQSRILADPAVKVLFSWQTPDGWLGDRFHGYHSLETGVRLLCEKGLDPAYPVLSRALQALIHCNPDQLDQGLGRPGRLLDQLGLGGAQMIRSVVLAYAGIEDAPGLQEQIDVALAGFQSVLGIGRREDLFELYHGKRVLRQGLLWPGIYHLRLLSWTRGWRTPENLGMLADSIQRLVNLSPIPAFNVRYRSQIIAPASFGMQDFNPDLALLDSPGWMAWFQRMELLARLGIIQQVPQLEQQLAQLSALLQSGDGWFAMSLQHEYFRKWGAYTGLMLEPDWKNPQRRICDLTFRSLLILHYSRNTHTPDL